MYRTIQIQNNRLEPMARALTATANMIEHMDGDLALTLARITKAVVEAHQEVATVSNQIVEKYARRDETGGWVNVRDENGNDKPNEVEIDPSLLGHFHRRMWELNNAVSEVRVPVFSDEDFSRMRLAPALVLQLLDFVVSPEEPE